MLVPSTWVQMEKLVGRFFVCEKWYTTKKYMYKRWYNHFAFKIKDVFPFLPPLLHQLLRMDFKSPQKSVTRFSLPFCWGSFYSLWRNTRLLFFWLPSILVQLSWTARSFWAFRKVCSSVDFFFFFNVMLTIAFLYSYVEPTVLISFFFLIIKNSCVLCAWNSNYLIACFKPKNSLSIYHGRLMPLAGNLGFNTSLGSECKTSKASTEIIRLPKATPNDSVLRCCKRYTYTYTVQTIIHTPAEKQRWNLTWKALCS